ncbi:YdcF family protein [Paenibacillus cremeus]|uniref:YdcF family protein n=1 Tax=Paenibacillus cremeus TaxID=2163881 RepID=UPI0021BD3BB8|nr:YdcF family protein [Paenibacillus cremeus]
MKKSVLSIAVLLIVVIIIAAGAGRFLVVDEPPRQSDVIVVLSGDKGERTVKGVELFQKHFAPYLLFSGGIVYNHVTMAELMGKHAEGLGIPKDAILLEDKADSTYENATFTLDIMKKKGLTSAIVVSSNYHMKRVKFLFEREFKNSGITLTYVAATDEYFAPSKWWSNNKSIMITINEYIKFAGYLFGKNA